MLPDMCAILEAESHSQVLGTLLWRDGDNGETGNGVWTGEAKDHSFQIAARCSQRAFVQRTR